MVKSRRRDPSREVRTDWPREILKIGTLEMRFPAMPLLASGQCYDFESDQSLFSTFRSDQSSFNTTIAPSKRLLPLQYDYCPFNTTIAPSIRLLPLQYDCCPFNTTVAPSIRLLPLQYDCCPFNTTVAPSIRLLPLQYDCCPFNTTAAPSIRLLPFQYDCCQIRPIPFQYDLRPCYTAILSLIPLHMKNQNTRHNVVYQKQEKRRAGRSSYWLAFDPISNHYQIMPRILIFQDNIQLHKDKISLFSVVSFYSCIRIISISTGGCSFLQKYISWRLTVNDFTGPRSTSASPSVVHNQRKTRQHKQQNDQHFQGK